MDELIHLYNVTKIVSLSTVLFLDTADVDLGPMSLFDINSGFYKVGFNKKKIKFLTLKKQK